MVSETVVTEAYTFVELLPPQGCRVSGRVDFEHHRSGGFLAELSEDDAADAFSALCLCHGEVLHIDVLAQMPASHECRQMSIVVPCQQLIACIGQCVGLLLRCALLVYGEARGVVCHDVGI